MPEISAQGAEGRALLLTCALPYANGPIHIGHLVEYIFGDILARYHRLRGRKVTFLCADDTHGTPIMLRAQTEGISPEDLIARSGAEHLRDFTAFDIVFDDYYSTHSPENQRLANEIYQALQSGGHIEERPVRQPWCPSCTIFLPDRFLRGTCPRCGALDQYGDACEHCAQTYDAAELIDSHCSQCGTPPQWREAMHLFFKVSHFEAPLRSWVRERIPIEMVNKLEEWFVQGLRPWDITRDAPYFGFPIPGRKDQFFYVWLDAPIGYMATTLHWCKGEVGLFEDYWKHEGSADVYHLIGKDITYFHAIFWPALLMASGYRTPTRLLVHGFLTVNGQKMSKSRGTFITAANYLKHFDPQYLRFYLASKLDSSIVDIDLQVDDFVNRINSDLVGKLANIPSRTTSLLTRHFGGQLGSIDEAEGRAMLEQVLSYVPRIESAYEAREIGMAVRHLMEAVGEINTYLQRSAPWQTFSSAPDSAHKALTTALNAFRIVATLSSPILPQVSQRTAALLNLEELTWEGMQTTITEQPLGTFTRLAERCTLETWNTLISQD